MKTQNNFGRALPLGIIGSFFFAFTFVLNRSMNLTGGYWLWGACLRYLFTFPIMLCLLLKGGRVAPVLAAIRREPVKWLLWSTVGFGLFYAPLSAASVYAASWFTAATWQVTIVAGVLLTPFFGKKIPLKNLLCACIILAGVFVMQIPQMEHIGAANLLTALGLILVAAFSYPLGNRKMMEVCSGKLDAVQRIFGMTLCSLPFWIVGSGIALWKGGFPGSDQVIQSFLVALFSGVIATILFFRATDLVKHDQKQLAVIEATQSGEVVFTLLLGLVVLQEAAPTAVSWVGLALIVGGMVVNSLAAEG